MLAKGDPADQNNSGGESFLPVLRKILMKESQQIKAGFRGSCFQLFSVSEKQCGLRPGWSCINQICRFLQLKEKKGRMGFISACYFPCFHLMWKEPLQNAAKAIQPCDKHVGGANAGDSRRAVGTGRKLSNWFKPRLV